MKNLPRIFTIIRIVGEIALLYIAWQHTHWSIAAILTLQAFAIEGIGAALQLHAKIIRAQEVGMQAAMQQFDKKAKDFNDFVATINAQADAVKEQMKRCPECEKYPGQIRPGSIHNSSSPQCQMHKQPVAPITGGVNRDLHTAPPRTPRPQCPECGPDTQNIKGNCPIHD